MNINNMKLKDVSEETLRNYLKELDERHSLILGDDLTTTQYQNGDPIPKAISNEQWIEFGEKEIGAYSINKNGDYLYNWYAIDDSRGLSPKGWRIPTDDEWNELEEQLKNNPSYAGYRDINGGSYYNLYSYGYFWSSTEGNSNIAWYQKLNYNNSDVNQHFNNKQNGFSVRCVKEKE